MPNNRASAVENESTRLAGRFTNSGAFYDPSSFEVVRLYAQDPTTYPEAVPIASITPTKTSTGLWYVDYTFTTIGVYYDKWRFIPFSGYATSEKIETVSVNSCSTSTAQDWTLLATWEAALNIIREKIYKLSCRINKKDGTLELDYMTSMKMLLAREKEINLEILKRKAKAKTGSMIASSSREGWD